MIPRTQIELGGISLSGARLSGRGAEFTDRDALQPICRYELDQQGLATNQLGERLTETTLPTVNIESSSGAHVNAHATRRDIRPAGPRRRVDDAGAQRRFIRVHFDD